MSQSIMDYIVRRLALDYMSFEDRSALGIYSAEERQRQLETGSYELVEETGNAAELVVETAAEAPVAREASVTEAAVSTDTQGAHTTAELLEKISGTAIDSPLCFTCGTKMRPAGSCHVCEGCGSTSGCS